MPSPVFYAPTTMVETRGNRAKTKANAAAARPPAKAAISTAKRVQPKRRSTTHDAPSSPALVARLNNKENGPKKNDTNVTVSVDGANYSPPVSSSSSESSVSDGGKRSMLPNETSIQLFIIMNSNTKLTHVFL